MRVDIFVCACVVLAKSKWMVCRKYFCVLNQWILKMRVPSSCNKCMENVLAAIPSKIERSNPCAINLEFLLNTNKYHKFSFAFSFFLRFFQLLFIYFALCVQSLNRQIRRLCRWKGILCSLRVYACDCQNKNRTAPKKKPKSVYAPNENVTKPKQAERECERENHPRRKQINKSRVSNKSSLQALVVNFRFEYIYIFFLFWAKKREDLFAEPLPCRVLTKFWMLLYFVVISGWKRKNYVSFVVAMLFALHLI